MQLTIDVKDSAIDKILYFLEHLKADVKILKKVDTNALDIEPLTQEDKDHSYIKNGRKERKIHPENYGTFNDVSWD